MAVTSSGIAARIKAKLEAITDVPTAGVNVVIADMRFINAIADALFDTLTIDVDVSPTSHSGLSLTDPSGQTVLIPSTGSPGSPSSGSVTTAGTITGKGKLL